MTSKQERLKEVYNHLRSYFGIHTQIDFAEAIRITRPALSSAMNGNEAYLTKNLFQKICAAYPGVFNLDYLLNGEGDLLTVEEDARNDAIRETFGMIDQSSMMNALIAAKDETIASLHRELDAKNETIALQRSRIADLERQLAAARMSDIDNYPFSIGAAEGQEQPNI
jgi:transcriptional regulator with XRE-family HTH domain